MDALIELLMQYPQVMKVVVVVGTLRLIVKPIVAAAEQIVASTPSQKDDEFMAKLKANPVYKAFVFVIDWFGSVKLPK
jgi:hypothetical protein